MSDLVSDLVAILGAEDCYRKPPRVAAPRVAQALEAAGWYIDRTPTLASQHEDTGTGTEIYEIEPPSWALFSEREQELLADGTLVARSQVVDAMHALDLDPNEVRAVVIEQHTLHVFAWSDTRRGQTVPIIEEPS